MRMALEKDAGFGSVAAKVYSGIKSFASRPITSTLKKVFWTRAKPGEIGKNVAGELKYGVKWGGGLAAGGIVAAPLFTSRDI